MTPSCPTCGSLGQCYENCVTYGYDYSDGERCKFCDRAIRDWSDHKSWCILYNLLAAQQLITQLLNGIVDEKAITNYWNGGYPCD